MKRIIPAAAIAMLLHCSAFCIDSIWSKSTSITMPKARSVTITMSYRPPQKAVTAVKKNPVTYKPATYKKVKKQPPAKAPPKIKTPVNPTPLQQHSEPDPIKETSVKQEDKNKETTDIASLSHGDSFSNMQVVKEATPLYRNNPPPAYPKIARKRGYQGTVTLSILVNEKGNVANLWVFSSSGHKSLDNAAIDAVKNWTFEPATKGGKAIDMWVNIPVRFELK